MITLTRKTRAFDTLLEKLDTKPLFYSLASARLPYLMTDKADLIACLLPLPKVS